MRTKTMLLGAAMLAAGLASSLAQNVYSVNVVGYYNISVPAHHFNLLANQFTNSPNGLSDVLTTGPVSDPNGNNNTVINFWNGHSYNSLFFYTAADATNNFYTPGYPPPNSGPYFNGWYDGYGYFYDFTLTNGIAFMILNPLTTNITFTVTGQVPQQTNALTVKLGFNPLSLCMPVSTNIDSVGFPGVSDPNGNNNDVLDIWNPATQSYQSVYYYTAADATNNFYTPGYPPPNSGPYFNGWYDGYGDYESTNPAFMPGVGSGFFVLRIQGGTSNWVYNFTVPQ